MNEEMYFIAVCSSGTSTNLSKCLDSILEVMTSASVRVQLMLVLNREQDCQILEDRFRIVFEPVRGYSSVRNRAIMNLAPDSSLIFVDDDEIVSREWLQALIEMHERYPRDLIVGPVFSAEVGNGPSFRSMRSLESSHFENGAVLKQAGAGNMLIPRALLSDNLVKFDMHFNESGSEDTDLCFRLKKNGVQIRFASKAVVFEHEPAIRYDPAYIDSRKTKDIVNYSVVIRRNESTPRVLYRFVSLIIRLLQFGVMSLVDSRFRMQLKAYALSLISLTTGRVRV